MAHKKHRILSFVQPGNSGAKVLDETLRLQKILDLHVSVLNVARPLSLVEKNIKGQSQDKIVYESKKELVSFVEGRTNNGQDGFIDIDVKVGRIDSVLTNEANSGKFEFILIDKAVCAEDSESKRHIDNIVSGSECPVLTIGEKSGISSIKNIAIPIDISQSTHKRLRWAQFFAKKFDARVTIVSVLNYDIKVENSLAYKNANKIKHLFWEQNIDCEVRVLPANGQKKENIILDYVEKERPDLMIIRTHQHHITAFSSIRKFVSEIIHGSSIPVLSVNYTPNPIKSLFL